MKERYLLKRTPEAVAFAVFLLAFAVVMFFHEPWYDEALAWQFAKSADLKDLFIMLPPYEGHTPFWNLILAVPARTGVPFEIGLKSVGFIITSLSVWIILFKCQMNRWFRLTLPFSYFIFYQYGVIVRPYSIMLLALLLLGIIFEDKNDHPWKTMACLLLLSLSSAFGILLAGGFSICWVIDIWKEKGWKAFAIEIWKDRRTRALFFLLVIVLMLVAEFYPPADGYSNNIQGSNSRILCLICTLFTILPNVLLVSSSWFGIERLSISTMEMPLPEFVGCVLLGCVLLFALICMSSKKNLKYFLIPYVFFSGFAALIYFSTHHIGIAFLLIVFYVEVLSRDQKRLEIGKQILIHVELSNKVKILVRKTMLGIAAVCIVISMYWSFMASINEIRCEYYYGRSVAKFIKESGLEESRVFASWNNGMIDVDQFNEGHDDYINTYMIDDAISVIAYFPNNIVYNLNGGGDNKAFVYHRIPTYTKSREMVAEWKNAGIPDVIIGQPRIEYVFDDVSYADYKLADLFNYGFIWKDQKADCYIPVFIRKG